MEKRSQLGASSSTQLQQTPTLAQSSTKKSQQNLAQADGPTVRSRNNNGVKKGSSSNSQNNGSGTFNENDTFNKFYNKELRVSKDEIPIVLSELNDSAIQFIKREQYEKALNLLQKAYGIMDVVDFNLCRRDKFHLFLLFHNMALCYQKMQMLEECSQCIEQALEFIPMDQFNLQEKSISNRMRKLQLMGKLKLQYCAILSQVHRHKDALIQSKEGVKIGHQLLNDLKQLCEFYIKREDIENSAILATNNSNSRNLMNNESQSDINYSSYRSGKQGKKMNSSRNRSFCQFLSQQEAYQSEALQSKHNAYQQSRHESSFQNLSSFYSANYLEESMSYIERTARKLLPILEEIKKRMIPEKNMKDKSKPANGKGRIETLDSIQDDFILDQDDMVNNDPKKPQADMKNILGYLNQGEWTSALSIGSIMQLQPFTLKDLLEQGKNELEMTRDSFIQKVSLMAVAYFCYSTEIRFILQMKEDPTFDPSVKQKESEYWHAKALELACTFLPSECPLLNHINLSYQKHFAPVKQTIMEDETVQDDLRVVKPLLGIDNPKFQPIIRQVQNIHIAITPYQMTPVNQITNQFLSQMISFNDYQEQIGSSTNQFNNQSRQQHHLKSKSGDSNSFQRRNIESIKQSNTLREGNADNRNLVQSITEEDDISKFEKLFEKLMKENKIDKLELLKKIRTHQDGSIVQNVLEEGESSQFNDILLDDQILAEDSQEDEQIASEAQHQTGNPTNNYKFRNKEIERPKTSSGVHRNASIGEHMAEERSVNFDQKSGSLNRQTEDHKKRQSRPLSGGLQKIKNESQRSRINKMNQNLSMYEKFGQNISGASPDKNMIHGSIGQKQNGATNPFQVNSQNQQNMKPINNSAQIKSSYLTQGNNQPQLSAKLQSVPLPQPDKKPGDQNMQAYEELKKRLLNEYKKLTSNKKTFDEQVREKYKSLKQRAVSGKKSQNSHSISGSMAAQQPSGQNQLSPKHHLNVYKPTFIINNSFGEGNTAPGQSKEIDVLDQISKKYRPSSKHGQYPSSQQQPASSNQQPAIPSGRQGSIGSGLSTSFHERQSSQYTSQQMMNNQHLLGLLMNQDKKSGINKKNGKSNSQMSQDLGIVKQIITEKGTNSREQANKQQNIKSLGSAYPNQPLGQNYPNQQQPSASMQKFMGSIDQQKRTGSSTGQKKPSIEGGNMVQVGSFQSQTKQVAYDKLKKKLNY